MAQRNNGQANPNARQRTVVGNDKVNLRSNFGQVKTYSRKKGRNKTKINRKEDTEKTKKPGEIITYVLDTNVIMGSWESLFKFEEHDVCIVSQVWQELDKHKMGRDDKNFHSRKAIRVIDSMLVGKTQEEILEGIVLVMPEEIQNIRECTGRLTFNFSQPKIPEGLNLELYHSSPDDKIIMTCLALKDEGKHVVLVSNDGNCRVKALVAGLEAQEYRNDAVEAIVAEEDIITGFHEMPEDFWDRIGEGFSTDKKGIIDYYDFNHAMFKNIYCNEFLVLPNDVHLRIVDKPSPHKVVARTFNLKEYAGTVRPRNLEQKFAIELLMDPEVTAVSLAGLAGSGKTYLALAAAFHQTVEERLYNRVIVTRSPESADEDIGFIPGDEEEKMSPWLGGVFDNIESFIKPGDDEDFDEKIMSIYFIKEKMNLQIKSMGFMKGRSLENTLFIIDETQDISRSTLKTMLTRIGKGSKVILLGNVAQIDNTFLTENTCGLSVAIRCFADSSLVGHITLQRGERSAFATLAEERL